MTPADMEVIEAFIDGRLSEADSGRLRELLRTVPMARAYLRSLATVDSGLRDLAFSPPEIQDQLVRKGSDLASDPAEEAGLAQSWQIKQQPSAGKPARPFLSSRILVAAAAVVAGIAIFLTMWELNSPQAERYVATVEHLSKDAQISTPVALGKKVGTAPIDIESGMLKLRFDSGAVVTLQGPARFVPVDERGGTLVHGTLLGKAPKDHSGLRIAGPNFDVADLGTEFALRVNKALGSELYVIEGRVALKPQGGERLTVERNGGYHIDTNERISALNEEQIQGAFGKALLTRRDPHGILTPDTVALLSFAGGGPETWRDLAANIPIPATIPADPETGAAMLNGPAFINLGSRNDLMIDSPKSFEARIYIEHGDDLEMLFSIHSTRIPKNREGWGVGIEADQKGILRPIFNHYDIKNYQFPGASLPIGRWFHCAITVGETQVRLYVDGELQGESLRVGNMKTAADCSAYIGGAPQRPSQLKGKISYIAIHRRVLTPQEIQSRVKPGDQP